MYPFGQTWGLAISTRALFLLSATCGAEAYIDVSPKTGGDLYTMCARSAALENQASLGQLGNAPAAIVLFARRDCQTNLANAWNAAIATGERLCAEGTIGIEQLEMIFSGWAQRHAGELGILPIEAARRAFREAFPCNRR